MAVKHYHRRIRSPSDTEGIDDSGKARYDSCTDTIQDRRHELYARVVEQESSNGRSRPENK